MVTIIFCICFGHHNLFKTLSFQLLNSQQLSSVQKIIKAFTLSIDVSSKTNEP